MPPELVLNPFRQKNAQYGDVQRTAFDPVAARLARDAQKKCPVYAPTPLVSAPGIAAAFGVQDLWIKDESVRSPLKSFKASGATYALCESIRDIVGQKTGNMPTHTEVFERAVEIPKDLVTVAATDGNHGRALAWGARQFGIACKIYLPRNVSRTRAQAIEDLGAELIFFDANYDETLQRCISDAVENNWLHLQDTSQMGLEKSHKTIMHGYSIIAEEIARQLPDETRPTHMFLQVGCGGMAASLSAFFWNEWEACLPKIVCVQSTEADPLLKTFEEGERQVNTGRHETFMVGIACGEIATLCEKILYPSAFAALSIEDDAAIEAMRICALSGFGDRPLLAGETGCSGLAGFITAARSADMRQMLNLDETSRILIVNTEGDTDPAVFQEVTGLRSSDIIGTDKHLPRH
ncbi:MAG: diaminopropionate ammonia-lyase [Pseudomonadota bacterium]